MEAELGLLECCSISESLFTYSDYLCISVAWSARMYSISNESINPSSMLSGNRKADFYSTKEVVAALPEAIGIG